MRLRRELYFEEMNLIGDIHSQSVEGYEKNFY